MQNQMYEIMFINSNVHKHFLTEKIYKSEIGKETWK